MEQKKKNFDSEHGSYVEALTDSQSYVQHKQEEAITSQEQELLVSETGNPEEDAVKLEAQIKVDQEAVTVLEQRLT